MSSAANAGLVSTLHEQSPRHVSGVVTISVKACGEYFDHSARFRALIGPLVCLEREEVEFASIAWVEGLGRDRVAFQARGGGGGGVQSLP